MTRNRSHGPPRDGPIRAPRNLPIEILVYVVVPGARDSAEEHDPDGQVDGQAEELGWWWGCRGDACREGQPDEIVPVEGIVAGRTVKAH